MSSGGGGTIAYADYNDTYKAGNETATGPMVTDSRLKVWPDSSGQTFNWEPSTTIDFSPSELTWAPTGVLNPSPTPEMDRDILVDIPAQMARLMAEQMDDLMMNGFICRKKEKKMPQNEERTLFNVFVIDPEGDGAVVATLENVVAKDVAAAEKKAVFALASDPETQKKLSKDLEEYDFLVEDVADFGSIRAKKND